VTARADVRLVTAAPQGPEADRTAPAAERIRDRIAEHQDPRGWLDLNHPAALDLCAAALDELRDEISGHASALAGPRPEKYMREQLRGEHPLTALDLARLALTAPRGVMRFLAVFARECGYELVPINGKRVELNEAIAGVAETGGQLVAAVTRAHADGVLEPHERRDVAEEIRQLEERLATLKAAVTKADA
jgi:hypothetical protein